MGVKKWIGLSIAWMLLLPVIGCTGGSTGSVSGVVKVDGEPAPGLEVMFTPSGHDAAIALGVSQEGGHFSLLQGRGNTSIPVGDYKVSVTGSPDAESDQFSKKVPKQYRTSNDTPLTKKVVSGSNTFEIDLPTK